MATIESRVVRNVIALDASASCADAVRLMTARGIGSVGVRAGAALVGLVTEHDLVLALVGGADPAFTSLRAIMRADLPAVAPQATDAQCAQLMRTLRTRHLLVKEGAELVGVISMLDLVELVVEEQRWSIDQLESYIRGGRTWQLSQPITTIFDHQRAA